jgi:hypothetical protein
VTATISPGSPRTSPAGRRGRNDRGHAVDLETAHRAGWCGRRAPGSALRTRSVTLRAGASKSIGRRRGDLRREVAPSSGCGDGSTTARASRIESTSTGRTEHRQPLRAAHRRSRPGRSPPRRSMTGPVSIPGSRTKVVTPVTSSPARSACWTGAAPRQLGSSEKCRLTNPRPGRRQHRRRQDRAVGDDRARIEAGLQVVDDLHRLVPAARRARRPLCGDLDRRRDGRPAPAAGRSGLVMTTRPRGRPRPAAHRAPARRRPGCRGRRCAPSPGPPTEQQPTGLRGAAAHRVPAPARYSRIRSAGPRWSCGEVVEEQDAVEVVHLVQPDPGEEPSSCTVCSPPCRSWCAPRCAADGRRVEQPRERQAALVALLHLLGAVQQHRVDDDAADRPLRPRGHRPPR